jgi:hypothetical protein
MYNLLYNGIGFLNPVRAKYDNSVSVGDYPRKI